MVGLPSPLEQDPFCWLVPLLSMGMVKGLEVRDRFKTLPMCTGDGKARGINPYATTLEWVMRTLFNKQMWVPFSRYHAVCLEFCDISNAVCSCRY